MRYLLDTDTCSAYIRGNRNVGLECARRAGALSVSVLTVGELLAWTYRKQMPARKVDAIREFLKFVEIIDVDFDVAETFGQLRGQMTDIGQPRPVIDLFIASTAMTYQLELITHNTRDYLPIPGLTLDDWTM